MISLDRSFSNHWQKHDCIVAVGIVVVVSDIDVVIVVVILIVVVVIVVVIAVRIGHFFKPIKKPVFLIIGLLT